MRLVVSQIIRGHFPEADDGLQAAAALSLKAASFADIQATVCPPDAQGETQGETR
jgi:hypothetical protein